MKKILFLLLPLFFCCVVYGETIILNDGTTYKGNIHLKNSENVFIVSGNDLIKLDVKDIKEIKEDEDKKKDLISSTITNDKTLDNKSLNEILFQIGYDFYGKYNSNKMEVSNPTGITFCAQYYHYFYDIFAIGVGANVQSSREVHNLPGEFYFVPMYVSLKLRSVPTSPYKYGYIVAKFGYNLFYPDSKYEEIIKDKEDGLYYGVGIGIVYSNIVAELFYSISNADGKYISDNSSIDVDYSKYCISIGYAFDF